MILLPVVARELRVVSRRPATYWLRFWAVVAVMVVFFITYKSGNMTLATKGKHLLNTLGILAMLFSLFSGVFLTSDCLSSERREGTLGLMFLTDLKPWDVILGKLSASSLHSVFGLFSIFPILALPLLMGGVSGEEFSRLILVFCVTIFFSLGIGMWISARCSEYRNAAVETLGIVMLFTVVFPILYAFTRCVFRIGDGPLFLLWPCPFTAYGTAFDYSYGRNFKQFWCSTGTLFLLGLIGIIRAGHVLPHSWKQENERAGGGSQKSSWVVIRCVKWCFEILRPKKPCLKQSVVERNPYFLVGIRDVSARMWMRVLFVCLGGIWGIGFVENLMTASARAQVVYTMAIVLILHVILKILISLEASRRMFDDRKSGAMELLLATPLTTDQFLLGQWNVMKWNYRWSLWLMTVINVAVLFDFQWSRAMTNASTYERFCLGVVLLGGIISLWLDCWALSWVGMLSGLKARRYYRGVFVTLAFVLGLPWISIFFFVMIQPSIKFGAQWIYIITYFVLGFIVSLLAGGMARRILKKHFRELVTGCGS